MLKQSYKILANRWRPQLLKDVVEQDHIVTALKNIFISKKIHHSYIFCGPKGTGKTTLARLLTKGLLCIQGETYTPCLRCFNCKEIEKGHCLDFIEIDGASHTKVEEIRSILENIPYLPNKSKYKIYLIDEFHMLSKHSFNALLKTLEEPPLHIKFLLSTTEINKIPSTILSRSVQFNLQLISKQSILQRLKNILLHEKIKITLPALQLITVEAKGSLRDAITLTEHAVLLNKNISEPISISDINNILGRKDPKNIIACLTAIIENNISKLLNIIYSLERESNINWQIFFNDLIVISHKLLLIKIIKEKDHNNRIRDIILSQDIIFSDNQKKQLINIAENTQTYILKLVYQLSVNYRNEIYKNYFNPRIMIERILLNIAILNNKKK